MKQLLILLILLPLYAHAETINVEHAYIRYVVDGDTVRTKDKTLRLAGLQTPERGHMRYYKARSQLQDLVLRRKVKVYVSSRKTWGRHIAVLVVGDKCVNCIMRKKYSSKRYDHLLTTKQRTILKKLGWK